MFKTKHGSPIKINFLCDLCDHVATKYNNLLRHQRSKHQGNNDLHKATVHNNDEDNSQLFCCPLCPFAAISKKSLTMHKQKMHAVKTEMVKAPILKDAATAGGNKRTKMFSKGEGLDNIPNAFLQITLSTRRVSSVLSTCLGLNIVIAKYCRTLAAKK